MFIKPTPALHFTISTVYHFCGNPTLTLKQELVKSYKRLYDKDKEIKSLSTIIEIE